MKGDVNFLRKTRESSRKQEGVSSECKITLILCH